MYSGVIPHCIVYRLQAAVFVPSRSLWLNSQAGFGNLTGHGRLWACKGACSMIYYYRERLDFNKVQYLGNFWRHRVLEMYRAHAPCMAC